MKLEFGQHWHSQGVSHADYYFSPSVNKERDLIAPELARALDGKDITLPTFDHDAEQRITISSHQFQRDFSRHLRIEPRLGRFYPAGVIDKL
jgi:hypothetical protein